MSDDDRRMPCGACTVNCYALSVSRTSQRFAAKSPEHRERFMPRCVHDHSQHCAGAMDLHEGLKEAGR